MLHLDAAEKLQENTEWAKRWFTYFGHVFIYQDYALANLRKKKR